MFCRRIKGGILLRRQKSLISLSLTTTQKHAAMPGDEGRAGAWKHPPMASGRQGTDCLRTDLKTFAYLLI